MTGKTKRKKPKPRNSQVLPMILTTRSDKFRHRTNRLPKDKRRRDQDNQNDSKDKS